MPKPYFDNSYKKLREIIRVNHAGELGAQKIYQGQIKHTNNPVDKKLLAHMLNQEQEHLDYFSDKLKNKESRPTIFIPIWNISSYLLGAISAKLGMKTAMLVTQNVEIVIEEHYQEQIDYLKQINNNKSLLKMIKKFKDDETEHKNIAFQTTDNDIISRFCSRAIQMVCKTAIFLSKKF